MRPAHRLLRLRCLRDRTGLPREILAEVFLSLVCGKNGVDLPLVEERSLLYTRPGVRLCLLRRLGYLVFYDLEQGAAFWDSMATSSVFDSSHYTADSGYIGIVQSHPEMKVMLEEVDAALGTMALVSSYPLLCGDLFDDYSSKR